jgi:DNA-binding MarR family transcriptional regulator
MDDWHRFLVDEGGQKEPGSRRLASGRTPEAELIAELFIEAFRFKGALEGVGDEMAGTQGQTCSRWLVLRMASERPSAVPEIARRMGLTRQAVQRLADLLVKEKLAVYHANPTHARSAYLRLTPRGQSTLHQISSFEIRWSNRMANGCLRRDLETTLRTMRRIIERLERTPAVPFTRRRRRGQP